MVKTDRIHHWFGVFVLIVVYFVTTATNPIWYAAAQDIDPQQITIDVRFRNGHEIFPPQTPVILDVLPKFSSVPENLKNEAWLVLNVAVTKKSQPENAAQSLITELEIQIPVAANSPWFPVSFLTPPNEGIYEITISLQRKNERSANQSGYSILNFPANPLQRRSPKIIAETVVQCVVLQQTPFPRLVGRLDSLKKELIETVDTTNPAWWKKRLYIPNFPKIANLPNQIVNLSTPKIPEFPRLTGFRERSKTTTTPEQTNTLSEKSEKKPISSTEKLLDELYRQWKTGVSGRLGSGHLLENTTNTAQVTQSAQTPHFSVLTAVSTPNTSESVQEAWEALPLPIKEIGKPHLVELDYPSGISQTLGIGVVELLNDGDKVVPVLTTDAGICVTEEIVTDQVAGQVATHKVLFWPKTKQPMLLLVNRDHQREAQFGDVRLYRIDSDQKIEKTNSPSTHSMLLQEEPPTLIPKPFDGLPQRFVIGYLHRADFLNNLSSSAEFQPDEVSVTDWQILYDSSVRMIDSLRQCGYDGAMINAVSNESMLYPSEKLGTMTVKDSLELLFQFFDREQLILIPSLDFNFPIPEIEMLLRSNPVLANELLWSDQNGVPRYNLLHPLVRKAMLDIIHELVERYSGHASFGGITVLLTPDGSARLPLIHRELDDRTFQQFLQFLQETHDNKHDNKSAGFTIPPELTVTVLNRQQMLQRNTARAQFVQNDPKIWDAWIRWRTRTICDFYSDATKIVTEKRSDARFYLAAGTLLDHPEIRSYCLPNLSRWSSPVYILRILGFDPTLLSKIPSLIFLRPSRISSTPDSIDSASYCEFDSVETAPPFLKDGFIAGTLFYHDSHEVPAGLRNRRRFVKQLTQSDIRMFVDGGRMLPNGEEEILYEFLAAFRQLPAIPFQTFFSKDVAGEKSLQPVTVRYINTTQGLMMYLVNDAPFGVMAETIISASPENSLRELSLRELSGYRTIEPMIIRNNHLVWQVYLKPFDFVAVILNDPKSVIREVTINRPPAICGQNGLLKRKVEQLSQQIHTAHSGVLWEKLANPNFETTITESGEIAGWQHFGSHLLTAQLDSEKKNAGQYSLKLTGISGIEKEQGVILSEPFEAPSTGQLFISLYAGISENVTKKPGAFPLEVVLSAQKQGEREPLFLSYCVEPVFLPFLLKSPPQQGVRWYRIIVPFTQLPSTGLNDFRIGFRLFGTGTVWIDDIILYRMTFTSNEIKALQQIALVANSRCSSDRISDLLSILEGYWVQYLFRHIPVPVIPLPATPIHATQNPANPSTQLPSTQLPPTQLSAKPSAVTTKEENPYNTSHVPVTSPDSLQSSQSLPSLPPKKEEQSIFNRIKGWFSK
ncbi:MAG: hypothetical protein LBP87_13545 [Planctomycetaceae bacterium]|jgi:hypothetical protein|nr:hypothetical protein [Planctomycetaceae bacterium]